MPLPNDNSQLLTDATNYGKVFTGTTTSRSTAPARPSKNCPTSTCTTDDRQPEPSTRSSTSPTDRVLTRPRTTRSRPPTRPRGAPATSTCPAPYTTSVTIASANNIIVQGNLTDDGVAGVPTGPAVMGLVANQDVRVDARHGGHRQQCARSVQPGQQREPDVLEPSHRRRDPRPQALVHRRSSTTAAPRSGRLTINGALVQNFRGTVGTVDATATSTPATSRTTPTTTGSPTCSRRTCSTSRPAAGRSTARRSATRAAVARRRRADRAPLEARPASAGSRGELGGEDSNPDSRDQNPVSWPVGRPPRGAD